MWPGRCGVKSHPLTPFHPLLLPLSHMWKRIRCSCSSSRHAVLLISWVYNYIRMLVVLSERLLVFVWPVRVCARWLPVIARAWSQGSLSPPSATPASTLWPLHIMLVYVLVVSNRGKMRKEKAGKIRFFWYSETTQAGKSFTGMEDVGRL